MNHIVYITHEFPTANHVHGGVGSFIKFISKSLVDNGFKVSIVGLYKIEKEYDENHEGIDVYRIPHSRWKYLKFIDNMKRLVQKIDAIHENQPIDIVEGSELSFSFFPKNTAYKKVIRMHGGHHFFSIELGTKVKPWRGYKEKRSFNRADNFIAVSNYVGNQTKKYLHKNFNFQTIYNSVDIERFKPSNKVKSHQNQILFVGTVCEKKGIRQLVQSFEYIVKQHKDVQLLIVGRDWFFPDGCSYTEYLKDYIPKEAKENIQFLGVVENTKIPELLEKSSICVFPSHMEAMPIAWLEALSMGKAVIGSNIGPGNEAIIDNETGVLVDPYSPQDIAKAIIKLLNNKDLKNTLGNNAREDIKSRFNPDKIIHQNIDFYNSLI